ncbi:hypothetical protein EJ06DRAFT_292447 [Trichodelitschia bisporula]|uniref:Uncharacterized protein n=1 Tax=Trichodelitschia bisporula TaxID=703511 RepID=A0A6G1I6D9_9PEZI|nr:hypothetical protein EJ06DRAFT_292447 [Trichodelitschia bisporula]
MRWHWNQTQATNAVRRQRDISSMHFAPDICAMRLWRLPFWDNDRREMEFSYLAHNIGPILASLAWNDHQAENRDIPRPYLQPRLQSPVPDDLDLQCISCKSSSPNTQPTMHPNHRRRPPQKPTIMTHTRPSQTSPLSPPREAAKHDNQFPPPLAPHSPLLARHPPVLTPIQSKPSADNGQTDTTSLRPAIQDNNRRAIWRNNVRQQFPKNNLAA